MTDEEYLSTRPEMTKDEILDRSVEYLGTYLFEISNPKDTKYFDKEKAKRLDTGMYTRHVTLLYVNALINEDTFTGLMGLLTEAYETKDTAETRIREIIFPDVK